MEDRHFATVDGYIDSFPVDVKTILRTVRRTIRNAVPIAGETITYQIPTITMAQPCCTSRARRITSASPRTEG
jgi:uncharacterized protein YdhG (YjbR/CyaY superfamily)